MKQSAARIRSLLLLTAAALAVLVLLLWSGGGEQTALAYPGLTVAIDMDPSTTTDLDGDGVYETVDVNTFENCIDVTNGQQFNVVVSVLDVLDLTAFLADVEYDGSVVKITAAYTGTTPSNLPKMFMSAQPLSQVQNESDNYPAPGNGDLLWDDTDGKYEAVAFDASHTNNGDDGSGTFVRLTLEATAVGASPFNIDFEDIDGDTVADRGVMLRDVNAVILNDNNGDFFFDGPFINGISNIAVDQPDLDLDSLSDLCDPDDDGDGYCDPGVSDLSCTGSDNCPDTYNPSQSDVDGDGKGDECDGDADNDGYINGTETTHVSDALDDLSTPEVCDGLDNDGDTLTDEGPGDPPTPFEDIDADTVPDCVDSDTNGNLVAVDTDGDTVANMNDDDDDDDGTSDVDENIIGTDSWVPCNNGTGLPDWPPDFDGSKRVNILDVVQLTPPTFNSVLGDDKYARRKDLYPDGVINILDVVRITPPVFGQTCTYP